VNKAHASHPRAACVGCGRMPTRSAHIAAGTDGGMGLKPSDRFLVPYATAASGEQHRVGEVTFWSSRNIEPICVWLISSGPAVEIRKGYRNCTGTPH